MVFAVLLAIASTAAAVVLWIRVRRQSAQLGAAFEKIATLQLEGDLARTEQASLLQRVALTVAERDAATERAADLTVELGVAASNLADAARRRDELHEQLEALRADPGDAPVLWALELSRVDRRWQMSVAPGIDMTSPLDDQGAADQPRVALDIIAEALREETGTPIDIAWTVGESLSAANALLVVRIGEELLSRSVLHSEQVDLTVADANPGVALGLRATDGDGEPVTVGLPEDLAELAATTEDGVVTITIAEGQVR